jgi:hypothetical protein
VPDRRLRAPRAVRLHLLSSLQAAQLLTLSAFPPEPGFLFLPTTL